MNNMILGYHNFVCSNGSWQKKNWRNEVKQKKKIYIVGEYKKQSERIFCICISPIEFKIFVRARNKLGPYQNYIPDARIRNWHTTFDEKKKF